MNNNVCPFRAESSIPPASMLDRSLLDAAYYRDSYRVSLTRPGASVTDIFHGLFAHHPMFIKVALIVRHRVVSCLGLNAPTTLEVLHPKMKANYTVGDTIGVWHILLLNETELIVGENNKHLDFRLSVLKTVDGNGASANLSTVCVVHNVFGRIYLFFVVPFHKWGVGKIISNAVKAGRL